VTLIRTSLLNAVAVAMRMLSMLALNKILAVQIGPAGYGLVGQLQNAVTSITALASAGVGTGVTKYTAEYSRDSSQQHQLWTTAGFLGLVCSILIGGGIVIFRRKLALHLFGNPSYSDIFAWVAVCLVLYVFNAFLLAIINGLKEVELFVIANVANSFIALVITGLLAWLFGLKGALVALTVNQSISCVATILLVKKRQWFKLRNFLGWPSREAAFNLSQFTLMAIATSVVGPLSLIVVRNFLIKESGVEAAGYWEAMNRISNLYLMFISTPLSVYYLPRLSEITNVGDMRHEIMYGVKIIVPVTIFLALVIYLLRSIIVRILFSGDFSPVLDLFAWQLTGDVFRAFAWVFSFFLISRAMTKKFLVAELSVTLSFVALAFVNIKIFGVKGVAIAYAANNLIYLVILLFIVTPILSDQKQKSMA